MPNPRSDVVFGSSAVPDGELFVQRMVGVERISRPFEYELEVRTQSGDALEDEDIEGLLTQSAFIAFGAGHEHRTNGIVKSVAMLSMADAHHVVYRLVFAPRLHFTALSAGTRVFLDRNVPQIVAAVLGLDGLSGPGAFAQRLGGTHDAREYTLQYQESNLDFMSRLMESEGIWYIFDHGDEDQDQVIIGDANAMFPALPDVETVAYRPVGGNTDDEPAVFALERVRTLLPKRVRLRDYNYNTPAVVLDVTKPIDANGGRGDQIVWGEDFATPNEGTRVATLRSEQWLTQKWTYQGSSNLRGLRAGRHFQLQGHFLPQLDQRYLVTEVRHTVEQGGNMGEAKGTSGYRNVFKAIPLAAAYRPPLETPRPRIAGVIPARVDGTVSTAAASANNADANSGNSNNTDSSNSATNAAPIDALGRYRVSLMVDPNAQRNGTGSCWVRVAQLTANQGYGMHMPLHPGAEVLVAHVDGDPDRPVIVGAVSNGEAISPVINSNATQGIIRTRNQIEIHFDDDA